MTKALEDLKVLDLTQWESGPTCTEMFGFLGADVVKVEPPGTGDPARHFSTTPLEPGQDSFYFIYFNLNKKSITLDLAKPKGLEILKELAKQADVLVENFAPGVTERLGITYEALAEVNPRLIVGSLRPYGTYGPYADYPGTDLTLQAMTGSFTFTGWPDKPPVTPGPHVAETGAGVYLFGGLMAALHQRESTGCGQFVEISEADTAFNVNRVPYATQASERDQMVKGAPFKRAGAPNPMMVASDVYPTLDSEKDDHYIAFIILTTRNFHNLLKILGHEEATKNPEFTNAITAAIAGHGPEVDQWVKSFVTNKHAFDAFHEVAKVDVPVAVTLNTTAAMNDPHYAARKSVVEVEHPVRGRFKTLGLAPMFNDTPPDVQSAPLLGEHNEEVYGSWLGYTKDDIAKLKEVGVV